MGIESLIIGNFEGHVVGPYPEVFKGTPWWYSGIRRSARVKLGGTTCMQVPLPFIWH